MSQQVIIMKLQFLVAGVQKGATSALHYYLRQHPDLYLPTKKELHFFDNEKIDWSEPVLKKIIMFISKMHLLEQFGERPLRFIHIGLHQLHASTNIIQK